MQLTISSVDHAPPDLDEQVPLVLTLLREIPGDDRPDYWLAESDTSLHWFANGQDRLITHLVLAARWHGTSIAPGATYLPVGIAYIIDQSLLTDSRLDLKKCAYVAIGTASDTTDGRRVPEQDHIQAGHIAPGFGTGHGT